MKTLEKHIVLGIHITDRVTHIAKVQELLTQFGCYIKTRIGLHEASADFCSTNGLIILEMIDDESKFVELVVGLKQIEGVEIQKMIFNHP